MRNRYFPQHLRATRPYYDRTLLSALEECAARRQDTTRPLLDRIVSLAKAVGIEGEGLLVNNFLMTEVALAQTFVQLESDGTPLYDIEPSLLEALAMSDPGDVRLSELRAPNRVYYMHWGPQPDLLLFGKYPVEGALVASGIGADWRIVLAARTPHHWLAPPERDSLVLRYPASTLDMSFEEATDKAIAEDIEGIRSYFAGLAMKEGGTLSLSSFQRQARLLAELEGNSPVLKRALALVANCMAYLTAYPEDSRFAWQPDTPQSHLIKMKRGGKEEARTRSKLMTTGFLQVHRVGLDFQLAHEASEHRSGGGEHLGGSVRPHWRRGHWRYQAHGPEMSLRKLIWLWPRRILGGPGHSPAEKSLQVGGFVE